ncbi:MAG: RNase adapter RapZ [Cystobacterineae bacterium]|nr:RNase adapter RapZ [Cystobacterineae bacterium]
MEADKLNKRIVVISGMSGSGKSTAISALEDMGYFCMDNLPSPLLPSAVSLAQEAKETRPLAFVVDVREGPFLEGAPEVFETLSASGKEVDILFLDSSDEVLLRRYSETRRRHPLAMDLRLHEGILREREKLSWLKSRATRYVDTSSFSVHELKATLRRMFSGTATSSFVLNFMSFGFRFGIPSQADLVFDVRFLKNPHFVPKLRPLTGREVEVADYVFGNEEAQSYFQLLKNFLGYMLPKYADEGKSYVTICIGCTGGKHRSVAIAQALFNTFQNGPWTAHLWDRDISHNGPTP